MPRTKKEVFKRNNAFSLYDLYGNAQAHELLPRGSRTFNYNLSGLFIGHHYNILSFSDLCLKLEKEIFKEITQLHYMNYMATS